MLSLGVLVSCLYYLKVKKTQQGPRRRRPWWWYGKKREEWDGKVSIELLIIYFISVTIQFTVSVHNISRASTPSLPPPPPPPETASNISSPFASRCSLHLRRRYVQVGHIWTGIFLNIGNYIYWLHKFHIFPSISSVTAKPAAGEALSAIYDTLNRGRLFQIHSTTACL